MAQLGGSLQTLLQQRCLAPVQSQKLFRIVLARKGPEATAGSTGQNDGLHYEARI
ncbi:hypothetical protein GCM10009109_31060 [Marinobacterium sediminicola]